MMNDEGYKLFKIRHHTALWQEVGAKNEKLGFGGPVFNGDRGWHEKWVMIVRSHCEEYYGKPGYAIERAG